MRLSFQHDMAYGDFKDLARRTASDKSLTEKAFNIAKNPKFDKNSSGSGVNMHANNKIKQNNQ